MPRTIGRVRGSRRRATAVVEMAVVAPLIILILFGIIEFAWLFFVKQTLLSASRIGARTATLPGSTEAQIRTDIDSSMTNMGFPLERYPYVVTITRATQESPYETVRLRIPYQSVSLMGGFFNWLSIQDLENETTYRREVESGP